MTLNPDNLADPRLLLIGLGNPLRGDDALGPLIADHFADHPSILAIRAHGLFPEHAELLSHHRLAIIIDAAATGTPGSIAIHRVPLTQTSFETHDLTPDTLLSLTQTLYGRTPRTILITIAAEHFDLDQPLSPSAQLAMQKVIHRLRHPQTPPPRAVEDNRCTSPTTPLYKDRIHEPGSANQMHLIILSYNRNQPNAPSSGRRPGRM